MANGQDGGRRALAGFLYQIVGMLSVTARASFPVEFSQDGASDEVDSLLILDNVGGNFQAHHEWFEDAVFVRGDSCVLVQFKYSSVGKKINVGDARKIIDNLEKGVERAKALGYNVTACVLFSNRILTSKGGKAAKQEWATYEERSDYDIRYYQSETTGALIRDIQKVGRIFGLFPAEIERGIDSLIGRVLSQAGDLFDRQINKSDFLLCFVGSENAQPLTIDNINRQPDQHLEELGEHIDVDQWNGHLIEREIIGDVINAINENRALIALCGPGGCGKSTILWQVLTNLPPGHCCKFSSAEEILESWVEDSIHHWRGLLGNSPDIKEQAIQRLTIANQDASKPVFWLGLDGIDEGVIDPERREHIRGLLRWFWRNDRNRQQEVPQAILLVSMREERDLHSLLQIRTHRRDPNELPLSFAVTDFSDDERERAAEEKLPELHQRIRQISTHNKSLETSEYSTDVLGDETFNAITEADELAWETLKHPVMWQALLNLDPEVRRRVIEGEGTSQSQLAHEFIFWFGYKLEIRHGDHVRDLVDNDCGELIAVLMSIAMQSEINAVNHREENWINPARQTPIGISLREAENLYRESLSAGLISEDTPRTWRWRHPLIYNYLVGDIQGDANNE